MIELEVFGITDRGLVRETNEDCFAVGGFVQSSGSLSLLLRSDSALDGDRGLVVAVADGIGGRRAGQVASRYAAESVAGLSVTLDTEDGLDTVASLFSQTIAAAHHRLADYECQHPESAGLGTTLTGLCFVSGRLVVFHVGDSRAYRYRDSYLGQLTVDHTTAGELRRFQPGKSKLTNSVGGGVGADCRPDFETGVVPKIGDVYLLCSDGLSDMVDEAGVKEELAVQGSLSERAAALVSRARNAGAPDNVTVVLIRIGRLPNADA